MCLGKEHIHGMLRGFHRMVSSGDDSPLPSLPRFPGKPDTMMTSPELLEERRAALEQYLNDILECQVYREHPEMVIYSMKQKYQYWLLTDVSCMKVLFLEVSRLSFLSGSVKGQEGFIKKRHGDFRSSGWFRWQHCMRCQLACWAQCSTQWGRRWLVVLDTCALYVNIDTGEFSWRVISGNQSNKLPNYVIERSIALPLNY